MISIRCIRPATAEPVTLEHVKTHCRVDGSQDDALLMGLISAARQQAEGLIGRVVCESLWDVVVDGGITGPYTFPLSPCTELTEVRVEGNRVDTSRYTFTPSGVSVNERPMLATVTPGSDFPRGNVCMTVKAGWPEVPAPITQWMLVRIGTVYEQREAYAVGHVIGEMPRTFVDALLDPFIIPGGI